MLIIITVTAIIVKQPPYMMLPLAISIFIMLLQTDVSRYAFLLGGINSIIYATVYFIMGIYASALYTLLFSSTLQIITFLNWKKHAYKNSTILKSLSVKQRVIMAIGFLVCWSIIFLILYSNGNTYAVLDTTSSLLGTLVSCLALLAYKEYPYISILSGITSMFLNIQICINDIHQLPYFIFSIYSCFCIIITAINVHKLYLEQKEKQL